MNHRLLSIAVALLCVATNVTHAQDNRPAPTRVVTLTELVQRALTARPALDADAAQVAAAEADVRRVQSAYHPSISLEAQASIAPGRQLRDLGGPGDSFLVSGTPAGSDPAVLSPQARYGVSLDLRSHIYDFGRTAASVDASRAARNAVAANGEVAKLQIVQAVRAAYLAWVAASELAKISAAAAADASERRKRVEALIAERVRPSSDLAPATSDELLARLECDRAEGQVAQAQLTLEATVGSALPANAAPDGALLETQPSRSESGDPERRALELQRDASLANAEAQEHLYSPSIGVQASAGMTAQNERLFPIYSLGVGFSLPLWTGGGDHAAADAARARGRAISAQIREHEAGRDHLQRAAQLDAEHAARRLATAEALLAACRVRVDEAEASHQLGGGDIESIGAARTMLHRAEIEVVLAKVARADASLRLSP